MTVPHRRIDLPNGAYVLLAGSSTGNPPGHTGGMTTNSSTTWVRLVRGAWDSGWHNADTKSIVKIEQWWRCVQTEADICDAWEITTGSAWPPSCPDSAYLKGIDGLGVQ